MEEIKFLASVICGSLTVVLIGVIASTISSYKKYKEVKKKTYR